MLRYFNQEYSDSEPFILKLTSSGSFFIDFLARFSVRPGALFLLVLFLLGHMSVPVFSNDVQAISNAGENAPVPETPAGKSNLTDFNSMISRKHLLVLFSYHNSMQWEDQVMQGIGEFIDHSNNIEMHCEFMDTKRYSQDQYLDLLEKTYAVKYSGMKIDCVIAVDDNAINFALKRRSVLFPDAPVVFCGLNFYDPQEIAAYGDVTGVVEDFDALSTIQMAQKLHPDVRRLLVINDSTTTGLANRKAIEAALAGVDLDLAIEFTGNLTGRELGATLSALGREYCVLLMSFNRDREGKVYRYRDAAYLVRSYCPRPVYGVWSFYLGSGIIGGVLTDGVEQGKAAVKMAREILLGKKASSIPVATSSPKIVAFDYSEMVRFGIRRSDLPSDSFVRGEPDEVTSANLWVIFSAFVIVLLQSGIIAVMIINILKRLRVERNLEHSRQELVSVLDSISDALISVDENGKVTMMNPRASELLGFEDRSCLGRVFDSIIDLSVDTNPFSLVHSIESGSVEASPMELLTSREFADMDLCLGVIAKENRTKSGFHNGSTTEVKGERVMNSEGFFRDWILVSHRVSPITGQKNGEEILKGYVIIFRDITEQRRIEEQLSQSRKMDTLGQLAGGVAHDFNNMLTGIMGAAELIAIEMEKNSPLADNVRVITETAARAAELTSKLLSFARKGKIRRKVFDIHEVINEITAVMRRCLPKSIAILSHLATEKINVSGDPAQIQNVLLNLSLNARDAIDQKDGILELTTSLLIVDEISTGFFQRRIKAGKYVKISVRDDGCGMSIEVQKRIFEPFFTTKGRGRGTGLGLASAYGIVASHNGIITVYSEEGCGTVFHVYLPVCGEQITEQEKSEPLPDIAGARVLVVDDEEVVRITTCHLLKSLGAEALGVSNGNDAISIVRDGGGPGRPGFDGQSLENSELPVPLGWRPDIVILDMAMPGMNGLECLRALEEITNSIKIIIASGISRESLVDRLSGKGVSGHLDKPFRRQELAAVVRSAMDAN
ncbi:MAG: hypothetical protein CVV64_12535 [Candidatus Wallbacteria bacterium HGW-Wallbacteria-1]|jgi:signal transduction histidine kinase|uniref:histidine kinase n=1 Tax=Candidatus Wallbacteria bacterium HGW-Wallbacteria-1 TaxID=2013854 RepID=A0A2N1PNB5_9BACT|nr:MAG: hypothetical protein CVV64_12535 [Candidatus Wallbacteria bacterium HGW-Wallbacteria-1]